MVTYVQLNKESELNKDSQEKAKRVKNWIDKYTGEDIKFEVRKKVSVKLNKKEKQAMIELKNSLIKKDYTEKELFDEFYKICEKTGIKNSEFFDAAYRIIIGKSKGPRLASLILLVGKKDVAKLLEQV